MCAWAGQRRQRRNQRRNQRWWVRHRHGTQCRAWQHHNTPGESGSPMHSCRHRNGNCHCNVNRKCMPMYTRVTAITCVAMPPLQPEHSASAESSGAVAQEVIARLLCVCSESQLHPGRSLAQGGAFLRHGTGAASGPPRSAAARRLVRERKTRPPLLGMTDAMASPCWITAILESVLTFTARWAVAPGPRAPHTPLGMPDPQRIDIATSTSIASARNGAGTRNSHPRSCWRTRCSPLCHIRGRRVWTG